MASIRVPRGRGDMVIVKRAFGRVGPVRIALDKSTSSLIYSVEGQATIYWGDLLETFPWAHWGAGAPPPQWTRLRDGALRAGSVVREFTADRLVIDDSPEPPGAA